jgi:integrase/recombinase XerD
VSALKQCYTRSIRQLVDFYSKTQDQINEAQLEDYFLHRKNKDLWSPATMRIAYSGIKSFFINVLKGELILKACIIPYVRSNSGFI